MNPEAEPEHGPQTELPPVAPVNPSTGAPEAAAEAEPSGVAAVAYGGFGLAGMQLALPMAALREVLPCPALAPLPCPARCVLGGIDLRGVRLPVVDLRVALGQAPQPLGPGACVVVMVHEGQVLGLLVDSVSGVFAAEPGSLCTVQAPDQQSALLAGSVRRNDDHQLVTLLSPQALASLPQVPMVADPEPERAHAVAVAPALSAHAALGANMPIGPTQTQPLPEQALTTMVLMRCGELLLAIDAMGIYTTLPAPQVQPSVLAQGHCRGVIDHSGLSVPAVDLLALTGLGSMGLDGPLQAMLVRAGGGLVGVLVDAVIDVVRVDGRQVLPVPAFALPRPELFEGALPMSALAPDLPGRVGVSARHLLVLSAAALQAHPDLTGLGSTNAVAPTGGAPAQAAGQPSAAPTGVPQRRVITFMLQGEVAAPIDQVAEILPFEAPSGLPCGQSALLGLQVHRGQAIPVLCLSRLQGLPANRAGAGASVLVVDSGGEQVGFVVPALRSIDMADWPGGNTEPCGDGRQDPGADSAAPEAAVPQGTRALVTVGRGSDERLLRMLDLQQLARDLRTGVLLAA